MNREITGGESVVCRVCCTYRFIEINSREKFDQFFCEFSLPMSALSPQICQFFRGRLAPNPRVYMATFFYPLKCISVRVVLSIPRALASIVHRPSLGCRLHNVY